MLFFARFDEGLPSGGLQLYKLEPKELSFYKLLLL